MGVVYAARHDLTGQVVELLVDGDDVDGVRQQDHVAVVLRHVAGEDAAQAVEVARFLGPRALLPVDDDSAADALGGGAPDVAALQKGIREAFDHLAHGLES